MTPSLEGRPTKAKETLPHEAPSSHVTHHIV